VLYRRYESCITHFLTGPRTVVGISQKGEDSILSQYHMGPIISYDLYGLHDRYFAYYIVDGLGHFNQNHDYNKLSILKIIW